MRLAGKDGARPEPISLSAARATSFLRQLKEHPFVAIIVIGDHLHIYRRADVTEGEAEEMLLLAAETTKEE